MSGGPTEVVEVELPRHPTCSAEGRRWLEQQLADVERRRLADIKLIVTELVNNAYIHGKGTIKLRLDREPSRLRAEVIDDGSGADVRITRKPIGRGGQGLKIVEYLSMAWGAHEGTTHVWAEISL